MPQRSASSSILAMSRLTELEDSLIGELILRHCPGRRVLDVGEGSREILDWVVDRATDLATLSPRAVADLPASGWRLPWPDESFDTVYSVRTLSDLATGDPVKFRTLLDEMGRVLAVDGTALYEVRNRFGPGIWWGRARGRAPGPGLSGLARYLPADQVAVDVRGIGVFVHVAGLHRIPLLRQIARRAEWIARDNPLLRPLGTRLVVTIHRVPQPNTPAPDRSGDEDGLLPSSS